MKSTSRTRFATILLGQMALLGTGYAQTWDGGGADTNINTAGNWNPDAVPALNGSAAGSFGAGGSTATMNVGGWFTSLTFNRDSSGGFTINGPSTLSVTASTAGSTANLLVADTASNGVTTINAPLQIRSASGTQLLVIDNREANTAGASLVINGGISSNSTTAYGLRFAGAGSTRITGALSGTLTTNIQQANVSNQSMSGTVTIAGNQSIGAATVNIVGPGSGAVVSTAKIVMGDSTADVQSWGGTTVNQAATIEIKSTATTGAIAISSAGSGAASGGTLEVSGNLTATTLAIGSAAYSGTLRVSGAATFSGAVTSGATAGSKIVGGGSTDGTLTLTSGTIGGNVTIGGAGTNENNLALVKTTTGTLTINSTNTYTGGTTLADGGAGGSFGIALGANNALGTGALVIGTAATGNNGARLRMSGYNQTVSTLSSGATTNARVIENFGASNSTLTVNGSGSGAYAGFLRDRTAASATATGNVGLVKDGAGTLTLSNTSNQYTGATVINGGVLEVSSLANGGIVKTVNTTSSNATVTMTDTTGINSGMTFVAPTLPTGNSVAAVAGNGTDITISTTSGIVTGTSTAHFGTASSLGLATSAASNLVFGGGTLRYTGGNTTTDRNFTINAGQSAKWDVANPATVLTLTGGAAASIGGFEKLGDGTLILSGTHDYTGQTKVTAGTLALGASNRISDSSTLVLGGGTFDLAGFSETLGGLDLDASATIALGAANSISFGNSASLDWGAYTLNFTSVGGGLVANAVRFGTSSSGLTSLQLSQITVDGIGGYSLDANGFLTAIPEPAAFGAFAGLGALGLVLSRRRRRV